MELCLYNAIFTAMSLDCKKFTYVNQLASSEKDLSERFGWFQCACCPPNVLRLLGMIGGYLWNVSESNASEITQVDIHLYAPATVTFRTPEGQASLKQECDWPRDGSIRFSLTGATQGVQLKLRIPDWATSWTVSFVSYAFLIFPLTSNLGLPRSTLLRCHKRISHYTSWVPGCASRLHSHYRSQASLDLSSSSHQSTHALTSPRSCCLLC